MLNDPVENKIIATAIIAVLGGVASKYGITSDMIGNIVTGAVAAIGAGYMIYSHRSAATPTK